MSRVRRASGAIGGLLGSSALGFGAEAVLGRATGFPLAAWSLGPGELPSARALAAGACGWRALYDLERDPEERSDRSAEDPRLAGELAAQGADGGAMGPAVPLGAQDVEALRELGYLQ